MSQLKRRRLEVPSVDTNKNETDNRKVMIHDLHQGKDKPPNETDELTANWYDLPEDLLAYMFGFMNVLDLCRLERISNRRVNEAVRQAIRQSQRLYFSALNLGDSRLGSSDAVTGTGNHYLWELFESEDKESTLNEAYSQGGCNLEVLEVSQFGCLPNIKLLPRLSFPGLVCLSVSDDLLHRDSKHLACLTTLLKSLGPTLRHLNLKGCFYIGDEVVLALANDCSFQLESLLLGES